MLHFRVPQRHYSLYRRIEKLFLIHLRHEPRKLRVREIRGATNQQQNHINEQLFSENNYEQRPTYR